MQPDDSRVEKSLTLRQALVAAGMREPKLRPGQARQRHNVILDNGDLMKSYIVANFDIEAGTEWSKLKPDHKAPSEIWPL
jgi:hypothetical protein